MPVPRQRRLRKSLLECAQCAEGPMECSKTRPHCDECKSQRLPCRYGDHTAPKQSRRQSDTRSRKAIARSSKTSTSGSSIYSSPSPTETHDPAMPSPSSSLSPDSKLPTVNLVERAKVPQEQLSADDQRLLDNWVSSTEHSLSHRKSKDRLWQAVIRRESSRYLALHHSTMALSAMQLALAAETGSAKRRTQLRAARKHYTHAVDKLPAIPNTPSPPGCNASFSSASVLFMCDLASSALVGEDSRPSHRDAASSLQNLLDLIKTAREFSSNPDMLDTVENGELRTLFTQTDPYHQLPSTYTLTILTMRNLNNAHTKKDPAHETAVYDDAIGKLDKSLEMLSKGSDPTMIALRWMFRIPSRFIALVEEKQPLALIIFAHYCAVLHHLRDRWWMGEWGTQLVKEIAQLLGPERISSILWAANIVGVQT
ncbi:C6 zinc finger domain protein [Aspergillus californicus]